MSRLFPAVLGWVPSSFPVCIAGFRRCSQCSDSAVALCTNHFAAGCHIDSTWNRGTVGTRPEMSQLAVEHGGNDVMEQRHRQLTAQDAQESGDISRVGHGLQTPDSVN
jgi:hypothetical protein